jgi:probable rRNA maturation factor
MPAAVRVQAGAALAGREGAAGFAEVRRLLARAVRAALRQQRVASAEMSVTLLDDAEIADMNREFLQHEGPTDVIAFALFTTGEEPVGDLYIGYDQVLRQAAAHEVRPAEELVRVTVHGVLHVLGYDHPEGGDRVDSGMWHVQEAIVQRVFAS